MTTQSVPLEAALDMANTIPCSPSILPALLKLIEHDDVEIHEIERIIRSDTGLATAILRLANSAFFGSTTRCESLDEAMLRLGSRTVYRLAATAAASRWLSKSVHGYGWEPGDLARHSLVVAIAAEALCTVRPIVRPEIAYTAGLIHDVGKLAMAYANPTGLEEVEQRAGEEGSESWRELESQVIGYQFTNISEVLLHHWGFPASLVAVGTWYPEPRSAEPEERPLVTLIHAAKHLAVQLGIGVGSDGFFLEADEQSLAEHGFDKEMLDAALTIILERLKPFLGGDGRLQLVS